MIEVKNDLELFELCKEVYKRTGWKTGHSYYQTHGGPNDTLHGWRVIEGWTDEYPFHYDGSRGGAEMDIACPSYASDYLLEKLPPVIQDPYDKVFKHLLMWVNGDKSTHAGYVEPYAHDDKVAFAQKSDEMRKTLLKLVLALDDAGVKL